MLQTELIRETARAKINLTLEILGRRDDGYHALASLVMFADVGDVVTLDPAGPVGVSVDGPFGGAIVGENILTRALDLLGQLEVSLRLGAVTVTKNLPVSAGVGGGSANAAALLRAVGRLNPQHTDSVDWFGIAAGLGADVPVCLLDRTAWMTGVGDHLEVVGDMAVLPMAVVLVNPMARVPADKTHDVFQHLNAAPLSPDVRPTAPNAADFVQLQSLIDFAVAAGNNLERPARSVVPEVGKVLDQLRKTEGCRLAAMSGAGPTCFGVFDGGAALAAAEAIKRAHPSWWVCPTWLRDEPL